MAVGEISKSIVVAVSQNGIIGRDGGLPWRLSTDLKRFKSLTIGKPVIAGRKTFESFGRPLPGRPNIVVTRGRTYRPPDDPNVHLVHSLGEAVDLGERLARETGGKEICIVGGGDVYRQSIGLADLLLVTHVQTTVEGDTSFPPIDPSVWRCVEEVYVPAGESDNFATRFVRYERRVQ
jgi:dihydrofolate reductase